MKRVLVLLTACMLASVTGFLPWKQSDAAALLPVETLLVDQSKGKVQLAAMDGLYGEGNNLQEAMEDMASNAPGVLFFGQVTRVIVGMQGREVLQEGARLSLLRLNTAVYCASGRVEKLAGSLAELEPYLRAQEKRGQLTTLLQYCTDGKRPMLIG